MRVEIERDDFGIGYPKRPMLTSRDVHSKRRTALESMTESVMQCEEYMRATTVGLESLREDAIFSGEYVPRETRDILKFIRGRGYNLKEASYDIRTGMISIKTKGSKEVLCSPETFKGEDEATKLEILYRLTTGRRGPIMGYEAFLASGYFDLARSDSSSNYVELRQRLTGNWISLDNNIIKNVGIRAVLENIRFNESPSEVRRKLEGQALEAEMYRGRDIQAKAEAITSLCTTVSRFNRDTGLWDEVDGSLEAPESEALSSRNALLEEMRKKYLK